MSGLFGQDPLETARDGRHWHFVRVAVERGLDRTGARRTATAADGSLTYKSAEPVPVGRRVEVPLGRGDPPKVSAGVVVESGGVELAAGVDVARIRPISRDTGLSLPSRLVELGRWIATYYVCPLGMVFSAMMPAAVKRGTGRRARLHIQRLAGPATMPELPPSLAAAWERIAAIPGSEFPIEPRVLAGCIQARTLGPINRLIRAGLLGTVEVEEVTEFGAAMPAGWQESLAGEFQGAESRPGIPTPTLQQQAIVDGIGAAIDRFGVHLIRGITGSGKTEVYLRLIERVLDAGRTALVLVPEISLTPQTAARFSQRFGHLGAAGASAVAVLHSGLTASQRHKQWLLAARPAAQGGARVVVGARSAVFAPINDLGLIVVDEEHAGDYKQDQLPRYHGRDVAIKRGHIEGCPVVLGSATPSLESWLNAGAGSARSASLRSTLWELTERPPGAGVLPPVEVVDLNLERKRLVRDRRPGERDPRDDLIGPRLQAALHETLAQPGTGQAILLLNRRGYASYTICANNACGYRLQCDACESTMVHHRVLTTPGEPGSTVVPRRRIVRCHHCLAQQLMPEQCPLCGGRLMQLGMGTQRLEEELAAKFPGLEHLTARVDGDTTRSGRQWHELLDRFARGDLRLLLGTQMIAKGLDFPNVRLVGVVNAETAAGAPDFRATERTFQLISQVAGRAGRSRAGGRVIVQTMEPQAPAIRFAAVHDYVGFAAAELAVRRSSGLPPARRMARIVCRDRDHHKARSSAETLATALRHEAATRGWESTVQIDGPNLAPIGRIAGYHRFEILLMASQRMAIQDVLAAARDRGLVKSDAHTAVDVDPMTLM